LGAKRQSSFDLPTYERKTRRTPCFFWKEVERKEVRRRSIQRPVFWNSDFNRFLGEKRMGEGGEVRVARVLMMEEKKIRTGEP